MVALSDDVAFATVLEESVCMSAWVIGACMHASIVKTGFLYSDGL
jgi:hypothetical protein